jgi:solute carrier family 45 protein 1/2/4
MYGWAPLALMGEEINKLGTSNAHGQVYSRVAQQEAALELARLSTDSTQAPESTAADLTRRYQTGQTTRVEAGPLAGVYLGIWNIYATVPQFLATFISMIVFSVLEPGVSPEFVQGDADEGAGGDASKEVVNGLSGTAVCLAIGAICSLVAATLSFRLRKM